MPKLHPQVVNLLKAAGACLERSKKHLVFKLSNGETFVASHTPSDVNAYKKQLSDLRRAVGARRKSNPTPGSLEPAVKSDGNRRKRYKPGRSGEVPSTFDGEPFNPVLAEQLSKSGLIEARLRAELEAERHENDEVQRKLVLTVAELCEQIRVLHAAKCWWCRLKSWWVR